eukprot:m.146577 g.146577  ORF g.146577 m.146577 type:complete len:755 (-) comp10094_c0_seq3:2528-4792(-)
MAFTPVVSGHTFELAGDGGVAWACFGSLSNIHDAALGFKERDFAPPPAEEVAWFSEPSREASGTVLVHNVSMELPAAAGTWRCEPLNSQNVRQGVDSALCGVAFWHTELVGPDEAAIAALLRDMANADAPLICNEESPAARALGIHFIGRYSWDFYRDATRNAALPDDSDLKLASSELETLSLGPSCGIVQPRAYLSEVLPTIHAAAAASAAADKAAEQAAAAAAEAGEEVPAARWGRHVNEHQIPSGVSAFAAASSASAFGHMAFQEYNFGRVFLQSIPGIAHPVVRAVVSYTYNSPETLGELAVGAVPVCRVPEAYYTQLNLDFKRRQAASMLHQGQILVQGQDQDQDRADGQGQPLQEWIAAQSVDVLCEWYTSLTKCTASAILQCLIGKKDALSIRRLDECGALAANPAVLSPSLLGSVLAAVERCDPGSDAVESARATAVTLLRAAHGAGALVPIFEAERKNGTTRPSSEACFGVPKPLLTQTTDPEMLSLLLDLGAPVNGVRAYEFNGDVSPLVSLLLSGKATEETVDMLIAAGADVNEAMHDTHWTALAAAVSDAWDLVPHILALSENASTQRVLLEPPQSLSMFGTALGQPQEAPPAPMSLVAFLIDTFILSHNNRLQQETREADAAYAKEHPAPPPAAGDGAAMGVFAFSAHHAVQMPEAELRAAVRPVLNDRLEKCHSVLRALCAAGVPFELPPPNKSLRASYDERHKTVVDAESDPLGTGRLAILAEDIPAVFAHFEAFHASL